MALNVQNIKMMLKVQNIAKNVKNSTFNRRLQDRLKQSHGPLGRYFFFFFSGGA